MILSDSKILEEMETGNIKIEGFNRELLNPNSVDLTLAPELKIYPRNYVSRKNISDIPFWARNGYLSYTEGEGYTYEEPLDVKNKIEPISIIMTEEGYVLYPNEVYLYACNEKISVKGSICAQVQAKSSLGRLGLDIVIGPAGFIDSGFSGSLVLELRATRAIRIYPDMKICQIKFERVEGMVNEYYGDKLESKYQNQEGVQESLYYKNFKS